MLRLRSIALIVPLTGLLLSPQAHAHISLEQGGTHLSRYGDADTAIKEAPCGRTGGARGTNVYTYEAGATITVSVLEAIPHPGYFRIAFDADGDDGFRDPVSIDPIDPARACPSSPTDQCGASDFYNTPEVLMDNLDPHIPAPLDFISPKTFTWQVTLPNVTCDSCTLQIIQVMEDDAFHGPYDVTPGVGIADVYHQCVDLVLTRSGGPGAGGASGGGTGGSNAAAGAPSGGAPAGAGGAGSIGGAGNVSGAGNIGGGAATTGGSGTAPGSGGSSTSAGTGGSAGGGDGGETSAGADADSGDDGSCTVVHPGAAPDGTSRGRVVGAALGLGLLALRRRRR